MDKELQQIVDETRETYGLDNYYLGRYHLQREKNSRLETLYYLSMEWFPNTYKDWDKEDENPEGTASIEVDIHTKSLRSIIFVGGISYSKSETAFPTNNLEHVIEWVEEQTGLLWGRQFQLAQEKDGEFLFRGVVDNVPISPNAMIKVKFNANGQFTFYSILGVFPKEGEVDWEPFNLVPEAIEPLLQKQCQLVQFPNIEKKSWDSLYAVEEIFVSNDGKKTTPFDVFQRYGQQIHLNKLIEWKKATEMKEKFVGKPLFVFEEVTIDQVRKQESHPDFLPITEEEITACIEETTNLLRQEFPHDSGKWILETVIRERYLVALLKPTSEKQIFNHKLKIFIDSQTLKTVNYMDSSMLFSDMEDFKKEDEINIFHQDAFHKLRDKMKVTPVYVYNGSEKKYRLCGKVDCDYGVDAMTGKVIHLDEL